LSIKAVASMADTEQGVIPSGQHRGKTVDAVWAEDPQYVWFLSQRGLTHVQRLRYKAFFESCPGAVQRAVVLTEGLSIRSHHPQSMVVLQARAQLQETIIARRRQQGSATGSAGARALASTFHQEPMPVYWHVCANL